ncbi:MAG: hypothetical protein FIA92_11470 [Chloroflexi bacterium]|nr:hypothetical protein [Chloroflexota bacterium]
MRKFRLPRPGYCAACEGVITTRPVYRMDEAYCCIGCAEGGPCVCNYEADLADDGVDHLGLLAPVEVLLSDRDRAAEPVGSSRGPAESGASRR